MKSKDRIEPEEPPRDHPRILRRKAMGFRMRSRKVLDCDSDRAGIAPYVIGAILVAVWINALRILL